jgi:hypothetical protein
MVSTLISWSQYLNTIMYLHISCLTMPRKTHVCVVSKDGRRSWVINGSCQFEWTTLPFSWRKRNDFMQGLRLPSFVFWILGGQAVQYCRWAAGRNFEFPSQTEKLDIVFSPWGSCRWFAGVIAAVCATTATAASGHSLLIIPPTLCAVVDAHKQF